jgi:hypothetical protein
MRKLLGALVRLAPFVATMMAVALGATSEVRSATIVINNGLAPPNPANVIDASNSHRFDEVYVQNVGCDATVAYSCPQPWGDPTGVEVVAGGSVYTLAAFESSAVTISGGSVGDGNLFPPGSITAYDASTVTMSGGEVGGALTAYGSSTVTLTGGAVGSNTRTPWSYGLTAFESASVTISGGSVGGALQAYDSSSITIIGAGFAVDGVPVDFGPIAATSGRLTGTLSSGEGIDNAFLRSQNATITLVAGPNNVVINNGLAPPNPDNVIDGGNSFPLKSVLVENVGCDATIEHPCPMPWGDPTTVEVVEGGSVGLGLWAYESSRIAMRGGSVGDALGPRVYFNPALAAADSSSVTLSGGSVEGSLFATDSSTVTMRGGSVGLYLAAYDASSIVIVGTGFAVDGVPVEFGPLAATTGTLTGMLESGEPLLLFGFCHQGGTCGFGVPATGLITLVPEPDTSLLFPFAAISLVMLRAASHRRAQ